MFKNGLKISLVLLVIINVFDIDILEPNLGSAIFVGFFARQELGFLGQKNKSRKTKKNMQSPIMISAPSETGISLIEYNDE